MNRLRLLGVAMFAMGVLGGCTSPPAVDPDAGISPVPIPGPAQLELPRPLLLQVPAIGAESTLVPTGINPDGSPEVPPLATPGQASWYCPPATGATAACDWPMPGETGPATVYGHVNGNGQRGVFADLDDAEPGDEVLIGQTDGSTLRFVVDRVETTPKAEFDDPTSGAIDRVYGPTDAPELRLITCGGPLDAAAGNYLDQVVVYARLA